MTGDGKIGCRDAQFGRLYNPNHDANHFLTSTIPVDLIEYKGDFPLPGSFTLSDLKMAPWKSSRTIAVR